MWQLQRFQLNWDKVERNKQKNKTTPEHNVFSFYTIFSIMGSLFIPNENMLTWLWTKPNQFTSSTHTHPPTISLPMSLISSSLNFPINDKNLEIDLMSYRISSESGPEPIEGCEEGKVLYAIRNLVLVGNQRRRSQHSHSFWHSFASCLLLKHQLCTHFCCLLSRILC